MQVEEVVAGTNTGKSPQLASYYQYWERAIFAGLNTMVLSAMNDFHALIKACNIKKAKEAGQAPRKPLFKVQPSTALNPVHQLWCLPCCIFVTTVYGRHCPPRCVQSCTGLN
jgi:hypothetical protein